MSQEGDDAQSAGVLVYTQNDLKIRDGANLSQLILKDSVYHVTFRLADSLPQSVFEVWKQEYKGILGYCGKKGTFVMDKETDCLNEMFLARIDMFLDTGYGDCCLKKPEVAETLENAIRRFDRERYNLYAWAIMPNHVHLIISVIEPYALPRIIHSIKSFSASAINRILKRTGRLWKPEYYDHIIRNEDELVNQIQYVYFNPRKSGLMDWKWKWIAYPMNETCEGRNTPAADINAALKWYRQ
jgi:REP element-mobilizing transposase RayT